MTHPPPPIMKNRICCCLPPVLGGICLSLFSLPQTADAGEGKWIGNDIELHLYLAERAEVSEILGTNNQSWEHYLRVSAQHYFDSHEGRSKIARVYVYNGIPEGKQKADIWASGTEGASAHPNGLGVSSNYLFLPGDMHTQTFTAPHADHREHHAKTLAHEVGHYFYGLADVYGGHILTSGSWQGDGEALPVEHRTVDPGFNYRPYMWSDQWLRNQVSELNNYVSALASPQNRAFYNLSGRPVGGIYLNESIMGVNLTRSPYSDAEFSTPASHVSGTNHNFKMPKFTYVLLSTLLGNLTWSRAADKSVTSYKLVNDQQWRHGRSDWSVIADWHNARLKNTSWTVPANLTTQTLSGAQQPEVIIVGDSAVVICLDRSGSMTEESRMPLAKAGAQSAVNLMRVRGRETPNGHFAGISSFADSAGMNASITEITGDATRATLSSAVQGLVANGVTNIGGGLRVSMNALLQHPEKSKTIILLSDGFHNTGENPSTVVPDLINNKITVYTIAVGSSADRVLLKNIADLTGGDSRVTDNAGDLLQFFHDLFAKLNGSSSGTTKNVDVQAGGQFVEVVKVEQGCKRGTFTLQLEKPWMKVLLRNPKGVIIDSSNITDPKITFQLANNQAVFDVIDPIPGDWKLQVDNRKASISGGPYTKRESPALVIPDLSSASSTLQVTKGGICNQLQVTVDILHTFIGDLTVRLYSPSGKSVILHNRTGGGTDNIKGIYGKTLTPTGALNALDGEEMRGAWRLEIMDASGGDVGSLRSWSLSYGGTSTAGAVSVAHSLNNPDIIVSDAVAVRSVAYPAAMPVRASVVAFGAPVAGVRVAAVINGPDGSSSELNLFDDGQAEHGDDQANDGIYSNYFTGYTMSGVYDTAVSAYNTKGWKVRHSGFDPASLSARSNVVPAFERYYSSQVEVTDVPVNLARWFQLEALQAVSNPKASFRDSVKLSGRANIPPTPGFDGSQQSFRFTMGNVWGNTSNGSLYWKRAGRSNRWTYKHGTFSVVTDYFIGGSSRSTWSVNATRQNLGTLWGNPASVPVTLNIGQLSDTVNVKMDGTGTTYKMGSRLATPDFHVTTLSYKLTAPGKPSADSLVFTGKISGPFVFNPAVNSLNLAFDSLVLQVPAGSWSTIRGNLLTYKYRPTTGAQTEIIYDHDKGAVSVRVNKAYLQARRGNPSVRISCSLSGISGAAWTYQLHLIADKAKNSYRY